MSILFDKINILLIITALLNLVLGIVIFLNGRSKKINIIYSLNIVVIISWVVAMILYRSASPETNLFWCTILYITPTFVASSFLYFTYIFPSQKDKNVFLKSLLIFLINAIIILMVIVPGFIISEVNVRPGLEKEIIFTKYYWFYFIYTAGFFSYGFLRLFNKYRNSIGLERLQILYLLIGYSLSANLAFVTNLIMPWVGSFILNWLGQVLTIIMVGFASYAIVQYRLMDIRIIIKKTLVYSGLLAFVLVTYSIIVLSISVALSGDVKIFGSTGILSWKMFLPNMIAAIFIAVGFDPLKNWLSKITDKWLFKGEYNQQEVLSNLSDSLSSVIDLNEAMNSMMKTVTTAMRIKTSATFVLRPHVEVTPMPNQKEDPTSVALGDLRGASKGMEVKKMKALGYTMDEKTICDTIHPAIHYFEENSNAKIIITDELEHQSTGATNGHELETNDTNNLIKALKALNIALVMPIKIIPITNGDKTPKPAKLIGLFALGEKLSGDMFSDKDINLLEIAVKQTAASIEKARFYEEDQLKSEFVSIASHELLTPTSAIEGYLSMILDEKLAKVDKKADGYLRKVQASAQRLAVLVKDLLNVSRIEGGRVVVQWQAFNILDLVKTVIDELESKAREKKLKLEFPISNFQFPNKSQLSNDQNSNLKPITHNLSSNLVVFADKERLHQVIVNLIGNSIKYTEKGSVTVKITSNKIQDTNKLQTPNLKVQNDEIEIQVADTGIGMTDEDQKHLFNKFYRASNAAKYGAQGTGLGLYITKNLVELMGGRIWVNSVLEKGTTFHVTLKIATPEQARDYSKAPEGPSYVSYQPKNNN